MRSKTTKRIYMCKFLLSTAPVGVKDMTLFEDTILALTIDISNLDLVSLVFLVSSVPESRYTAKNTVVFTVQY